MKQCVSFDCDYQPGYQMAKLETIVYSDEKWRVFIRNQILSNFRHALWYQAGVEVFFW